MAVITLSEAALAKTLLKGLGISTPGPQMIAAVVAWMKLESGSMAGIKGNNPFNLRPGILSTLGSVTGQRLIGYDPRTGEPMYVLTFKTLELGILAAGYLLRKVATFAKALAAAKRGDALGFLAAIGAVYNPSKYGYKELLAEVQRYTGIEQSPVIVVPPIEPPQPGQPLPPVIKFPRQYKTIAEPGRPQFTYIDGYAAGRFYRARHTEVQDEALLLQSIEDRGIMEP